MQPVKYVSWEEDGVWLGYLRDFPDCWTQGKTLDDLKEHLLSLHTDLTSGQLETPHDLFRRVIAETGDHIKAIRLIRERFGLDFLQAKEVMLQAEGTAASLEEHDERLAEALEQALREQSERVGEAEHGDIQQDRS